MERPDSGVPLFEMFVLILVQIVQIGGGSGTTAQKAIYTYKTWNKTVIMFWQVSVVDWFLRSFRFSRPRSLIQYGCAFFSKSKETARKKRSPKKRDPLCDCIHSAFCCARTSSWNVLEQREKRQTGVAPPRVPSVHSSLRVGLDKTDIFGTLSLIKGAKRRRKIHVRIYFLRFFFQTHSNVSSPYFFSHNRLVKIERPRDHLT